MRAVDFLPTARQQRSPFDLVDLQARRHRFLLETVLVSWLLAGIVLGGSILIGVL